MLRELDPIGLGEAARAAEPIFELSVGYDLKGLSQPADARISGSGEGREAIIRGGARRDPRRASARSAIWIIAPT